MKDLALLAWYSLAHHRARSVLLALAVALAIYVPFTIHWLVGAYRREMTARAESTPLVIGPRGSRFDLAFHALHFRPLAPGALTMETVSEIRDSSLALPIPLYCIGTARGFPVVGTDPEYFRFRHLLPAAGEPLAMLGDCLIGANVARRLDLAPGGRLMTEPSNVFDIAGAYPLDLQVRGVLPETGGPDDGAVFVDIKTAWVIQGLGHGHQDVATVTDEGLLLERRESDAVASPALQHHTRITPENIGSFHFHGDPAGFPLTAVICVPRDQRAATILAGRYQDPRSPLQFVEPSTVIDDLLRLVFRIKRFFDLNVMLVSVATGLLFALIVMLSRHLRRRELRTLFHLGCSRGATWQLQAIEWTANLCAGAILAVVVALDTTANATDWLLRWLAPAPGETSF
jgi:putative ABC transport system permease protein